MKDINDVVDRTIDDGINVMTLRRLLGKSIIRTIYYVGAILYTIGALLLLAWAIELGVWLIVALVVVFGVAGNVGWRLACELWILLYFMHDKLTSIDKTLKAKPSESEP